MISAATSPKSQSTPAAQVCEHCGHAGRDVGPFVSSNDGSRFILCSDTAACMSRQGFGPEPEPEPPATPARAPRPLPFKRAQLRRLSDGRIQALSSDGATVYEVRLSPAFCSCPGYTWHGRCYHQRSARARFGARAAA